MEEGLWLDVLLALWVDDAWMDPLLELEEVFFAVDEALVVLDARIDLQAPCTCATLSPGMVEYAL